MNNMKKIGFSALAGSLVAFSANAVELSVSGKTEITYSGTDNSTTTNGNKWGSGNEITFSGSGDVNGMTATYTAVIQDGGQANSNSSETFASSSLMLDMGDLGTVGFDQGVGEFGVSTIDDKMPYAYEEIWTYTGASNGLQAAGGCNVLGYAGSMMGVNLSVEIDPGHTDNTTACTGDGSTTGAGTTNSGYNWALTSSALIDGLNVGVGQGTEEIKDGETNNEDLTFSTGFATYAAGPVTVGYQRSSANGGSAGTTSKEVEIYGASFNVNENFAVSLNQMDTEFDKTAGSSNVTEETSGIGASYTMGAASVRILSTETDNKGGSSTAKAVEHTEISLMLAF